MNRLVRMVCCTAMLVMAGCSPYATREPDEADLVGEYVPTEETLKRLSADGYLDRDICIVLGPGGALTFRNIPDCWLTDFGEPHHGFDSGSGRWKIGKSYDVWCVGFRINAFTPDSTYQESRSLEFSQATTVVHNRPPYELAISVAAGDRGYLGFRRR